MIPEHTCWSRNLLVEPASPDCDGFAVTAFFCRVEGREVRLCRPCNLAWRETARNDARLAPRCPACAGKYLATLAEARPATAVLDTPPVPERLTGKLADAIDQAMFAEGILIDKRAAVLARLGALGHEAWLAVIGGELDKV